MGTAVLEATGWLSLLMPVAVHDVPSRLPAALDVQAHSGSAQARQR
jgi:hypothetical protein